MTVLVVHRRAFVGQVRVHGLSFSSEHEIPHLADKRAKQTNKRNEQADGQGSN